MRAEVMRVPSSIEASPVITRVRALNTAHEARERGCRLRDIPGFGGIIGNDDTAGALGHCALLCHRRGNNSPAHADTHNLRAASISHIAAKLDSHRIVFTHGWLGARPVH